MKIFKRFIAALNDNAQIIHDMHCGKPIEVDNKLIAGTLTCTKCGQEVTISVEHLCTVKVIK